MLRVEKWGVHERKVYELSIGRGKLCAWWSSCMRGSGESITSDYPFSMEPVHPFKKWIVDRAVSKWFTRCKTFARIPRSALDVARPSDLPWGEISSPRKYNGKGDIYQRLFFSFTSVQGIFIVVSLTCIGRDFFVAFVVAINSIARDLITLDLKKKKRKKDLSDWNWLARRKRGKISRIISLNTVERSYLRMVKYDWLQVESMNKLTKR